MKIITQTKTPGDPLLTSFKLGHLTLRNRVMCTSHACGLADSGHMPGEAYQAYHLAKAQGGLALLCLAVLRMVAGVIYPGHCRRNQIRKWF